MEGEPIFNAEFKLRVQTEDDYDSLLPSFTEEETAVEIFKSLTGSTYQSFLRRSCRILNVIHVKGEIYKVTCLFTNGGGEMTKNDALKIITKIGNDGEIFALDGRAIGWVISNKKDIKIEKLTHVVKKTTKRTRCKNGYRKNKKTKKCEKYSK
jgi:hypothetical protein